MHESGGALKVGRWRLFLESRGLLFKRLNSAPLAQVWRTLMDGRNIVTLTSLSSARARLRDGAKVTEKAQSADFNRTFSQIYPFPWKFKHLD